MKIGIVTPAPPTSRYGNRVTALRWARILRKLGHHVSVKQRYQGEAFDLLLALHARKSHAAIQTFHRRHPAAPIVVGLTGTDVYHDIHKNSQVRVSLRLATRLIVLQPEAIKELPSHERRKARVIYQSVEWPKQPKTDAITNQPHGIDAHSFRNFPASRRAHRVFNVSVIGHLRPVKDPFRAAMAARLLPNSSRIRILQVGGAMSPAMARRARKEQTSNPRYRWLGEESCARVRQMLSSCQLCVLSSKLEGGANVLGETIVAGVPVLASRIPGSVGILGEDYPGYFKVGATRELARLLYRVETDGRFLNGLRKRCRRLVPLFDPIREETAWKKLLRELT